MDGGWYCVHWTIFLKFFLRKFIQFSMNTTCVTFYIVITTTGSIQRKTFFLFRLLVLLVLLLLHPLLYKSWLTDVRIFGWDIFTKFMTTFNVHCTMLHTCIYTSISCMYQIFVDEWQTKNGKKSHQTTRTHFNNAQFSIQPNKEEKKINHSGCNFFYDFFSFFRLNVCSFFFWQARWLSAHTMNLQIFQFI